MLEIGFGHKIPKLNFVSHLKISQENCRKKISWPNIPKKVEKSGKTLISWLMGKIPHFRVFPLVGGIICQMILFSNVLKNFLKVLKVLRSRCTMQQIRRQAFLLQVWRRQELKSHHPSNLWYKSMLATENIHRDKNKIDHRGAVNDFLILLLSKATY